ncbi:MAG: class I SAM-dependent methyltransferase [Dysgonamonadaceae bacterium]|nr:class I SAM-dependent methyltransferase [Dysgonamonadaceae bacterium]MDD4400188.1 class I SAM-dependent methyltransferase [Dysgonamonadaceae bacterium]
MQLSSEQKQFILNHENENVSFLALHSSTFKGKEKQFVLAQIAGRQISKNKIPTFYNNFDIIYPIHLSLEQASSEETAKYKASLFNERRKLFVDLTGGLGVDFMFLSRCFDESIYVEKNIILSELAEHNFNLLGLENYTVINSEAEIIINEIRKASLIFLDPARRDNDGRKVFQIEDCSPNLISIKDLLLDKSDEVLIKYSPMLDISLALKALDNVKQVHVVSIENECKELLFLLSKEMTNCIYYTVNLKKNGENEVFLFNPDDEHSCTIDYLAYPENYLYEPNSSILKAGGFKVLTRFYDVKKLHNHSHLYTSKELIDDFPGRIFKIEKVVSPNKKQLKSQIPEIKKANIAVRNFPMSVEKIRKLTDLKDGGDHYIFATTLYDEKKVFIICSKI